jgi:carbon monoxide dehydrogenase subunit G
MASIRREVSIGRRAESVWEAIRDIGALHTRLVVGFVVDCRLEGNVRVVTFANGIVAREVIVDLDDDRRRLVWSASGGRLTHHNASVQVFAEDSERCRVVWIADLLPDEISAAIAAMIDEGMSAMKRTLEGTRAPSTATALPAAAKGG